MSIVLLVYLASVVHSLTVVISLYAIFSIILIGVVKFAKIIHADETKKPENPFKHIKKWITSVVIAILLAVLIPSERTMYIMTGASIAQDIANSPKTAATLDKVYKIVDKKLEEQLSEGIDKGVKVVEKKLEEVK